MVSGAACHPMVANAVLLYKVPDMALKMRRLAFDELQ
jgi:hypothetical protein